MSLIVPSGFGEAVLEFTFTGGFSNPMVIVFGFENTNDETASVCAAAIGNEASAAWSHVGGFSNQTNLEKCTVTIQPSGAVGVHNINVTGESAQASLPPNCCVLVEKNTALGGRAGRGRMFWPSPPQTSVLETGALDSGYRTNMASAMGDLILGMASDFTPMVLLHTSGAIAPSPVLGVTVDPVIATQRRRMRS